MATAWQRDGTVKGLRHNGTSWVLRWRTRTGTQRAMSIGLLSELSPDEARRLAVGLRQQIREGHDPLSERRERADAGPTLGALVQAFIESRNRTSRPTTLAFYSSLSNRLGSIADRHARAVSAADLNLLLDEYPTPTANRLVSLLRASYHFGHERGWVASNPASFVRRRREPPRDRALSESEVKALLTTLDERYDSPAAASDPTRPLRMIGLGIRLLLATGQRVSEVLGTTFAEWTFTPYTPADDPYLVASAVWTIPAARRKQRVAHEVYVPACVAQLILNAHGLRPSQASKATGPLLPRVNPSWRHVWSHALFDHTAALGVEPWTLRDLRRTWATRAAQLGVGEEVIGLVLGHSPSSITGRVYARHARPTERYAALERVWLSWFT